LIPRNKKLGVFASTKTSAKYMRTDESVDHSEFQKSGVFELKTKKNSISLNPE
jgi:hypothetical protein